MKSVREKLPSLAEPLEEDGLTCADAWYRLRADISIQVRNYILRAIGWKA